MVRWRRASVVLASAGGNTVPVIARLAATSRDRVREVIHRFNDEGMASLDPRWAGGRPRRITTDDEDFIVEAATTRPEALGLPFTRWSLRKLAAYLGDNQTRVVKISAERLRQILAARGRDVSAHQDLEGVQRPRARRQAGPHRGGPWGFPAAVFRLRRVRAADDPPRRRGGVGSRGAPAADRGELPQGPRGATVPRLLLDRRGCPVGGRATAQVCCEHPGRAQVDPGPPQRRRVDLCDPRQPLGPQGPRRAPVGTRPTESSCASPRPTALGPTRSKRTSGRCASSCSTTPSTPTTQC